MVVLNRIYTRTGDDGTTALGSGERRKKYDLRVSAYGTLDEVNAVLGLVRLHTGADRALDAVLARVQNDLFDVEADLCLSAKGPGGARMTITDAQVQWLEQQIDQSQCRSRAAAFVHPAGREFHRRVFASRAHRLSPGGAADGRAQRPVRAKGSRRRRSNTSIAFRIFCSWRGGTPTTRGHPTCFGSRVRTGDGDHPLMVVPLYDDNPFTAPVKPVVTWCLIAAQPRRLLL